MLLLNAEVMILLLTSLTSGECSSLRIRLSPITNQSDMKLVVAPQSMIAIVCTVVLLVLMPTLTVIKGFIFI